MLRSTVRLRKLRRLRPIKQVTNQGIDGVGFGE